MEAMFSLLLNFIATYRLSTGVSCVKEIYNFVISLMFLSYPMALLVEIFVPRIYLRDRD